MEVSAVFHRSVLHQSEEQLELYSFGRLSEPDVAAVEEHLLVCASCRARLDEGEVFALALRQAIASEPVTAARKERFAWLRRPAMPWLWASGFVALMLAAGLWWNSGRRTIAPLASLQ